MKKAYFLFPLWAFSIFFSGCLPSYYPGLCGAKTPSHILIPDNQRSKQFYALDAGTVSAFNDNESNLLARAHRWFVFRRKFGSLNLGWQVYGGQYEATGFDSLYNGKYEYFGTGPEVSAAIFLPIGKLKIGVGGYITADIEGGNYHDFLKETDELGLANNYTQSNFALASAYPFISCSLDEETTISLQMAYGMPGYISPALSYRGGKYGIWCSYLINERENLKNDFGTVTLGIIFEY
ncbi:MAG: hypothetical protein Q7J16_08600 [Candidatus Cloacimonadales bacterium]|nr:hypothetical protein [Candidatus Cloacimonadales bacterium]